MGGNAFCNTVRLSVNDLNNVYEKVRTICERYNNIKIKMPAELSDKTSFGDVDIIYTFINGKKECISGDKESRIDQVFLALEEGLECPCPRVHNNDLTCFLTKDRFQVDFQFYPNSDFNLAVAVVSNGDYVWLLNKGLMKYGLKLTQKGFFVRKTDVGLNNFPQDLFLSNEPKNIAAFLGLDFHEFDGSTQLSSLQVYECVMGKFKYFHADFFTDYLVKNDDSKKHVETRPMLKNFKLWLEDQKKNGTIDFEKQEKFDKKEVIEDALKYYGKTEEFEKLFAETQFKLKEIEFRAKSKELFDIGKYIRETFPELSGPNVGKVIQLFKEKHGHNSWEGVYNFIIEQQQKQEKEKNCCFDEIILNLVKIILNSVKNI